jgi:hypothetical protein
MDKQTLLDMVAAQMDVVDILDILGWTVEDLVEELKNEIWKNREEFMEQLV